MDATVISATMQLWLMNGLDLHKDCTHFNSPAPKLAFIANSYKCNKVVIFECAYCLKRYLLCKANIKG